MYQDWKTIAQEERALRIKAEARLDAIKATTPKFGEPYVGWDQEKAIAEIATGILHRVSTAIALKYNERPQFVIDALEEVALNSGPPSLYGCEFQEILSEVRKYIRTHMRINF